MKAEDIPDDALVIICGSGDHSWDSEEVECDVCGTKIWFSPSSKIEMDKQPSRKCYRVCYNCVPTHNEIKVVEPNASTISEIAERLGITTDEAREFAKRAINQVKTVGLEAVLKRLQDKKPPSGQR